jgi:hypothetical protein
LTYPRSGAKAVIAMSDSDPPPDSAPPESVPPPSPAPSRGPSSTAPPAEREGRRRRRLEGMIPEIVRRAVELGVEKTLDAPDNVKQFVGDMKLPKEIAHYVFQQIDETKNGLFRVVAKEMRDFLEHTNFAGEMQKLLTTVQFEVNTTIRFTPNDGRSNKKKKSSRGKTSAEDAPAGGESDASDGGGDEDDDAPPESDRVPLPRPEVKTAVHVTRDDDDRKRRRDRG